MRGKRPYSLELTPPAQFLPDPRDIAVKKVAEDVLRITHDFLLPICIVIFILDPHPLERAHASTNAVAGPRCDLCPKGICPEFSPPLVGHVKQFSSELDQCDDNGTYKDIDFQAKKNEKGQSGEGICREFDSSRPVAVLTHKMTQFVTNYPNELCVGSPHNAPVK